MGENDLVAVLKRRVKTTDRGRRYGRHPNLVQGLFTRSLRVWNLARTLSTELALTALERALAKRVPAIHHSHQGVQYAAHGYVERLEAAEVQISIAAVGQSTGNAYAERVIRTIKEEKVYLADYVDFANAYHRIGHFIEDVYQTSRIHSALGYLTPAEFKPAYRARQDSLALPFRHLELYTV